jgi:hypothetical protein
MQKQTSALYLGALLVVCAYGVASGQEISVRPDLSSPSLIDKWTLDGSGDWQVMDGRLILAKGGTFAGAIHRPGAIAILKTDPLLRVTVQTQLRLTAPLDSIRRDLAVIFGYESPTRFYYAHFGGITDAGNNGIFLVDNADRRRIDPPTPAPQLKDQSWHRVRVVRDGSTGRIEVYFDDAAMPVFSAVDTTIRSGRIGVGSLNDYGEFRDIVVTGSKN